MPQEDRRVRWHIVFSGFVQGVGFRYTAYYLAKQLYLTGWVENLPDGRVEMEVQGRLSAVRRLLLSLKSRAPIRIDDMQIRHLPLVEWEHRFTVKQDW